jgi:hypothetical protein
MVKKWLESTNLVDLGHMKFSHMIGFFEDTVLRHISPYFEPLRLHLSSLWKTIIPHADPYTGKDSVHSSVTCLEIINVFKTILLDEALITQAEQAGATLGKRSLPGELDVASNGWDVVTPTKKKLMKEPNISPTPPPPAKI